MIKSFSGQVIFYFAILRACLLTLAKTDKPSIQLPSLLLHFRLGQCIFQKIISGIPSSTLLFFIASFENHVDPDQLASEL